MAIKTIQSNLSFLRSSLDEVVTNVVIKINSVTQISVARYKSIVKQDYNYVAYPFTPNEINIILDKYCHEQWKNLFISTFKNKLRSSGR